MDFKQIEAFANVVKYKSFSKAADACFLTQPTISAHISTLEKEMGVKLIERGTKGVRPTRQGQEFFKYALDMLNTRQRAIYSLQGETPDLEGVLEIQASAIPGQYMVPQLLCGFREKHPNVKFYLEQSDSQIVMDNLLEDKGEIGFTGAVGNNRLDYISLRKDRVVLITPRSPKFLEIREKSENICIEEFIKEPFLFREKGSGTLREFEDKLEEMGYFSKNLNVAARINSMETIKQSVSCGLGVSIVSDISAEFQSAHMDYLTFNIEGFSVDREFYLVTNGASTMSLPAEAFKNFTLEYYGAQQVQ